MWWKCGGKVELVEGMDMPALPHLPNGMAYNHKKLTEIYHRFPTFVYSSWESTSVVSSKDTLIYMTVVWKVIGFSRFWAWRIVFIKTWDNTTEHVLSRRCQPPVVVTAKLPTSVHSDEALFWPCEYLCRRTVSWRHVTSPYTTSRTLCVVVTGVIFSADGQSWKAP